MHFLVVVKKENRLALGCLNFTLLAFQRISEQLLSKNKVSWAHQCTNLYAFNYGFLPELVSLNLWAL